MPCFGLLSRISRAFSEKPWSSTFNRAVPLGPLIFSRMMTSAMGKRLEGKTVLVTGASSGIGQSTAMEFARTSPKALKLILTARRIEKLKQLAEDIRKEVGDGVKVLPFQLDVSNPSEVKAFVGALPQEFKDIDILVNNA